MVLIHEIGLFHGHRGLDRVLIHEIGLFHGDIEVWIGSLAIKLAFIMADEVRQGGRTVLQARRPTHNYPRGNLVRGDPVRGDPVRGNSGRGNPGRGDPGVPIPTEAIPAYQSRQRRFRRTNHGVPIPAGAEMHMLRIILACLLARWYICDRITSGQGENPDRR